MPSTWRVHVIGERLESEGLPASLDEYDVYALPAELRHRVLDVIVGEQASFPMVLLNGEVVSHDGVDLEKIVRAARDASAGNCC